MKHFIIFYEKQTREDGTHYYSERRGSDGIAYPDNRLNCTSMGRLAREIAAKRPRCHGFRIARGTRLDNLFYLTAAVQPCP